MSLLKKNDLIFIAGHNGMVGSSIKRNLLNNGYKNLITENRQQLDLLNKREVDNWYKKNKPDIVIIAAARVGGIIANSTYPYEFLLENLKIQNHLIEGAWRNKVRRLLFLGSSCIYPKFAEQPIVEEALLSGQLEDTNQWYAIAKIAGIKLCEALNLQYGFDAISLMPTNLYGPGDYYHPENSHVIPSFIRRFKEASKDNLKEVTCWGTGNPLREFLYVEDLSDACRFVLEKWKPQKNEIKFLNVGMGKDISIKELAEKIAFKAGYKGIIKWDKSKPDGTPKKLLNIEKIKQLGWKPNTNLDKGLDQTIKFYESYKEKNLLRN